jgi:hypothetical protein
MGEKNSDYRRRQLEDNYKLIIVRNGIRHERIKENGQWAYRDMSDGRFLTKRKGLVRFLG